MWQHLIGQAVPLHQAGRLAEAERLYLQALALAPGAYPALHLMGLLRLQQGRFAEALPLIERALKVQPGAPQTLSNYGIVLDALGRRAEALKALDAAVRAEPGNSQAWNNRGAMKSKMGRPEEALADFDRALALDGRNVEALNNRGQTLRALGRHAEALASYDRMLEIKPDYTEGRNNRGLALRALGRPEVALADFDAVLALRPRHAGVFANRAGALWDMGRIPEALASYDRALEIDPTLVAALTSRANLYWTRLGRLAPAIADLERAVALAPDLAEARADLLHMRMHAGDWRDFARQKALVDAAVRAGAAIEPYVYQALSDCPADLLSLASAHAARNFPARPALCTRRARQPGPLRLGYVCGEFRAQATMYLAAGLFEAHDRAGFRVIAFDNTREDGSAMRARVLSAFDRVVPIRGLSDRDAAQRVLAEDVDILVNLNGYFGALRMGVFAHRPAPIQVNYLGFPGTLGAPYIDYILADARVIPPGEERFYREAVVRLSGAYQINDDKRAPVAAGQRRADHGLPGDAFVFCHFNYGYKILPDMFACWMRLLRAVDNSVLWLLAGDPLFAENLRRAAADHGVDGARLIFAPPLDLDAHMARLPLGDLFLDSLPYNAHTTASDALWAGLPLLTCRGRAFAGRVAASLLEAVGLCELVSEDLEDYEARALRLARDPAALAALRARLAAARPRAALFDTARTTRAIEAAYKVMLARWEAGAAPAAFDVAEEAG